MVQKHKFLPKLFLETWISVKKLFQSRTFLENISVCYIIVKIVSDTRIFAKNDLKYKNFCFKILLETRIIIKYDFSECIFAKMVQRRVL